jgi:NAD(P)-dependent dehydrogenase (short-subunit alcohol dehydrogenase family)
MSSKIILVTGGNRGIGRGIVQSLLQSSPEHTIILTARKKEDADKTIAELNDHGYQGSLHSLALEVTNDGSIQSAVSEVEKKFGKLDSKVVLPFSRTPAHI